MDGHGTAAQTRVAGFWRRVAAFAVDALVLGAIGWALALALPEPLAALGAWGRLLGFAIAGAYFVPFDGPWGGGRSPGKRLLGLRVADAAGGGPLPVRRAAARYAILGTPWFLNGAMLPPALLTGEFTGALLSLLVFGVGGSMAWLLVFNRASRRSLHDLATGAVVLRGAPAGAPALPPLWRGHAVAAGVLLAAGAVAPFAIKGALPGEQVQELLALERALEALPGVRHVALRDVGVARYGAAGASQERIVEVSVFIAGAPEDAAPQAEPVADLALRTYPEASKANEIGVTFLHGFDIGFASGWRSRTFRYAPEQWRDRIAGGAQG